MGQLHDVDQLYDHGHAVSIDRVAYDVEMPDKSQWLESARKRMDQRGTVGSFKSAAKREGMSTMSFARKEKNSPKASGLMKKRANFAINSQK